MANTRTVQVVTKKAASPAYEDAARQRALANALQQRAMAPRDMSNLQGKDPYLAGLTQLGEALLARYAGKNATKAEAGADSQMRDVNAQAIEKLAGAYQIEGLDGEPATPLLGGSLPGNQIDTALKGMDPRQANQIVSQALLAKAMPQAPEPYTLGEGQRRYVGSQMVAENPKPAADKPSGTWKVYSQPLPDGKVQDYSYNDSTNDWVAKGEPYKPIDKTPNGSGSAAAPRLTQIVDPNNPDRILVVDATTNRVLGQAPKESPWTQRDATRRFSAQGLNDAFNKAEEVLSKGDPTASGIGALADSFLNFFGKSTSSAEAASDLDTLGAFLLTKVPKLKGADSEKDRANYEMQVGKVGDRTKPVEQRLTALKAARNILGKYDIGGQPTSTNSASIPSFATEAEAQAAGIKPGTKVVIGGVPGTWQ